MSKTIQRPLACRNAHCGAMCSTEDAEDLYTMFGGNPNKCFNYERRDDLYRQTEILDKVKKAREEISKQFVDLQDGSEEWRSYVNETVLECVEIMDRLIESEEKE